MRLNLSRNVDPTEAALAEELNRLKSAENHRAEKPKAETQRSSCQTLPEPMPTLTQNEERNGYEIRFTGPIPRALSNELMLNRWRYTKSLNDPRWYTRRTPKSLAYAEALLEKYNGVNDLGRVQMTVNHLLQHRDSLGEIRQTPEVIASREECTRQIAEIITLEPSPRLRKMLGLQCV